MASAAQAWKGGCHVWQVLSCFAEVLGFKEGYFECAHDRTQPDYQCTLRLLHYMVGVVL